MRKIAGPGSGSGTFTDYDPVSNPDGTVITADWANDVQNELLGVQDEMSIAEAAGSNEYVLAAIKGLAIQLGRRLGELVFVDEHITPAAFDKDNPEDFWPAKCLDTIDGSEDISDSNWPDLVPYLRSKRLTHREGATGEKAQFDVTEYAIASNVATLTFSDTTAENAILDDLLEDSLVNGGTGSWRAIELPSAIGDIAAGEYAITSVDTANRQVEFSYTNADVTTTSVTAVAEFPAHKVAGSSTTARLFETSGRSIVSPNDANDEYVSGLRRRDQMQQITGSTDTNARFERISNPDGAGSGAIRLSSSTKAGPAGGTSNYSSHIALDSANSPNARTGSETNPRALAAHIYLWGKTYTA